MVSDDYGENDSTKLPTLKHRSTCPRRHLLQIFSSFSSYFFPFFFLFLFQAQREVRSNLAADKPKVAPAKQPRRYFSGYPTGINKYNILHRFTDPRSVWPSANFPSPAVLLRICISTCECFSFCLLLTWLLENWKDSELVFSFEDIGICLSTGCNCKNLTQLVEVVRAFKNITDSHLYELK